MDVQVLQVTARPVEFPDHRYTVLAQGLAAGVRIGAGAFPASDRILVG